ncbi:hypothetical protein PAPYR_2939 [Paratrimastix pyriformis]|uniref:F-box domain-containing protein n=1 Tax=Paratrimastix pyriformis TaxID=342808 RepID=A0ABQ8URL0_9EUKA|nr:hypothetical protein PAPYR_2939 [Paratrimastix pyriformis]
MGNFLPATTSQPGEASGETGPAFPLLSLPDDLLIEIFSTFDRIENFRVFPLVCRRFSSFFDYCASLNLAQHPKLTDSLLIKISDNFHRLRTLTLEGNLFVTTKAFDSLTSKCPNLMRLHLRGVLHLDDECLQFVASRCPLLEVLDISQTRATNRGLAAIARGCPELRELLCAQTAISDYGLCAVAEHCPCISRLSLGGCRVTLKGLQAFLGGPGRLVELRDLDVAATGAVTSEKHMEIASNQICIALATTPGRIRFLNMTGHTFPGQDALPLLTGGPRSPPRWLPCTTAATRSGPMMPTKPNQTKPNQTKPNQTKPNQFNSIHTKFVDSSQAKPNQIFVPPADSADSAAIEKAGRLVAPTEPLLGLTLDRCGLQPGILERLLGGPRGRFLQRLSLDSVRLLPQEPLNAATLFPLLGAALPALQSLSVRSCRCHCSCQTFDPMAARRGHSEMGPLDPTHGHIDLAAAMGALGIGCTALRELRMSHFQGSPYELEAALRHLPRLDLLDVHGSRCPLSLLDRVVAGCPALAHLELGDVPDGQRVAPILRRRAPVGLRTLDLSGAFVPPCDLAELALGPFPRLATLRLPNTLADPDVAQQLLQVFGPARRPVAFRALEALELSRAGPHIGGKGSKAPRGSEAWTAIRHEGAQALEAIRRRHITFVY